MQLKTKYTLTACMVFNLYKNMFAKQLQWYNYVLYQIVTNVN